MADKAAKFDWRVNTATSADGTPISYLSYGNGPGLVVLPGNNRRARHYAALAGELADSYTLHVLDRRGRGATGPQGPDYSIEREVDDAVAVLDATGADLVFGHSYGGLVGLHLALRRALRALVVYEPGVILRGSLDLSWLPEFTELVGRGRQNKAMALFLKRSRLVPIGDPPMFVFRALALMLLRGGEDGADTRAMMATSPAEFRELARLDSDGNRYADIGTPTLLLGGSKTPEFITAVLPELAGIIPGARHEIIDGLDHNAPDLNAPTIVADRIRAFLAAGPK